MTEAQTSTAKAWKKAAQHTITLPSGETVVIRIPNLPAIIKAGGLPNELVKAAVKAQSLAPDDITEEDIKNQADFNEFLVLKTVIEPEITKEDLDEIPYEDVEMIVEIATRQRDMDAVGHHLAGLEKIDAWRRFRGLAPLDEDLPDV